MLVDTYTRNKLSAILPLENSVSYIETPEKTTISSEIPGLIWLVCRRWIPTESASKTPVRYVGKSRKCSRFSVLRDVRSRSIRVNDVPSSQGLLIGNDRLQDNNLEFKSDEHKTRMGVEMLILKIE